MLPKKIVKLACGGIDPIIVLDDYEEDNDNKSYTLPKRNVNADDLSSSGSGSDSDSDSDSTNDDVEDDYEVIGDKEGKEAKVA